MSKNILFLNPVPLIEYGISQGFKQNGWNIHIMTGENFVLGRDCNAQITTISMFIDQHKIDYIFWEFGVGAYFKEIHDLCKRKGVGFICWGIEDTLDMYCWLDQTVNHCDYYFTTTVELIPYAKRKYNKDIKLLMFGVNPHYHYPVVPNKDRFNCDIGMVANNYGSRYEDFNSFVFPLIENNYNINIWGNDWWMDSNRPVNLLNYPQIYKSYLGNHETKELYSTCKIGLGLQCHRKSESQMSMRYAEVMGVGNAIFISPWSKAQENYLGKSGEYAFFPKTKEEMIDNVNTILNMSELERKSMAIKAQNFVYKNYNYKKLVSEVIDIIT